MAAVTVEEMRELRDKLIRQRAEGILLVEYDGHRVRYANDNEMAAAIRDLERRIAAQSKTPPRVIKFSSSKGV